MNNPLRILVTGGAGFIGSALIRYIIGSTNAYVANLDALTYAGNLESLAQAADSPRHRLYHADIGDAAALVKVFAEFQPTAVMHLAAESHVDRSIEGPAAFIQTNIVGTYTLLEAARHYWSALEPKARQSSAFITFPPTRSMATLKILATYSRKLRPTLPVPLTPPRKPAPTTSSVPGTEPMAYLSSLPTARTTTALTISQRS